MSTVSRDRELERIASKYAASSPVGPHTVYCTVLYCTILYCTVLYCTVYCTVLQCSTWQLCLVWQELEPRHQPQPTLAPSCVQEVQLEWSLTIGGLNFDIDTSFEMQTEPCLQTICFSKTF